LRKLSVKERLVKGSKLLALILLLHVLLGIYAVKDEGAFFFGATSPERYIIHKLKGGETRYTISGALRYFLNDICIQKTPEALFECYPTRNLVVRCKNKRCELMTKKGIKLVEEGERLHLIVNQGTLMPNSTLVCSQNSSSITSCEIEIEVEGNRSIALKLPEEVEVFT